MLRWGLLAYGRIARKMESSIAASKHNKIVAIASNSQYDDIPSHYRRYRHYIDLLDDPEIDIIYVSTTHNDHAEWTIKALHAGKHVLCEKPMSTSRPEVIKMIEAARLSGKFLMEAIWMRYLPGYIKVREFITEGLIGEIQMIQANFGFAQNPDDLKPRLNDPALAAGAIWDVGIYPLALIIDYARSSVSGMTATGHLSSLGVDERVAAQYIFDNGIIAQMTCSTNLKTHNQAILTGTEGIIVMDDFWKCESFSILRNDQKENYLVPYYSTGLYHEVEACYDLIQSGRQASDIVSWDDSLTLAAMMDDLLDKLKN